MKTSVYRFSLDVNQSQSQVSISAGKGENGVRLIIRMTENGAPFEVEDGSYAVFSAVKPDGKPVINDCAIFGNDTVVYDFTEQTVAVEGITRCQILLFGPDRSLIASARFQIVIHETIWDKGIESAEEFNLVKKFVEDIKTVNDRLDKNATDIDVLESARPVTGAIALAKGSWSPVPDGFNTSVALDGNTVKSGDIVLVLPDDANTRIVSADMEVRVAHDLQNGEDYDVLYFKSKTMPTEALYYRFIVVRKGATDTEMTANALIVGVNDVPEYIKDAISENKNSITTTSTALTALTAKIDDPGHGLSAVEHKIDNFLYGVTDEARDQLSEVLGLIYANEAAIKQFVNMGGAPVGSGTLVVPKDQWSDSMPFDAFVKLPSGTIKNGSVMLITPANDETKTIAEQARVTINIDPPVGVPNYNDTIVLFRAETAAKPAIDMEFAYVILQTTATTSLVTLIGVDAAGGSEPTLVDLSRFEGVEQEDGSIKGYITEVFGEGEDAPTKVTEVVYDDAGNIIKIGNTAINWGEEG